MLPVTAVLIYLLSRENPVPVEPETIDFLSIEAPGKANPGDLIRIWCRFRSPGKMNVPYKMFVHLIDRTTGKILSNADTYPSVSTLFWKPKSEVRIGPILLKIPDQIERGDYAIKIGFFKILRRGSSPEYVRIPYTQPELSNYILANIEIPFHVAELARFENSVESLKAYARESLPDTKMREQFLGRLHNIREKLKELRDELALESDWLQTIRVIEKKIDDVCLDICVLESADEKAGDFGFFSHFLYGKTVA